MIFILASNFSCGIEIGIENCEFSVVSEMLVDFAKIAGKNK